MLALSIVFAAALVPLAFSADIPVFTLDCSTPKGYPGACETHCYAAACSKLHRGDQFRTVNKYLHFAEDSSSEKPNPPKNTMGSGTGSTSVFGSLGL